MFPWKEPDYHIVDTEDKFNTLLKDLENCIKTDIIICLDVETTGSIPESGLSCYHDWLLGVSFAWNKNAGYYIPFNHTKLVKEKFSEKKERKGNQLPIKRLTEELNSVLSKGGVYLGHNIKFDYKFLWKAGIRINPNFWDTLLAIKIAEGTNWPNTKLKQVIRKVVSIPEQKIQTFEDAAREDASLVPIDEFSVYAINDVIYTLYLYEYLKPKIDKDYKKIFYEVEMPLTPILAQMEMIGLRIDVPYLKSLRTKLETHANQIKKKVFEDYKINIASTMQVGKAFNDNFKNIRLQTSPKGNIVTDVEALNTMKRDFNNQKKSHPIYKLARRILIYRGISKALNTYIDKFPAISEEIYDTKGFSHNIIHTSFNQIVNSGRQSSIPNVQNIPRGLYADIRAGFIPRKGMVFVEADWKGMELRITAAASGEARMVEAFLKDPINADLHTMTAQGLFNKKVITSEERYIGKTINFSILYGATEYSVSKTLKCSKDEARKHINRFYSFYPGLRDWREDEEAKIASRNYSETFFGRRRYVKNGVTPNMTEYWHYNGQVRALINHIIQGTSADILKFSMIKMTNKFAELNLPSYLLTSTHDSVIVETKEPEETVKIVKDCMDITLRGIQLPVDLEVKTSFSKK